MDAGLIHIYYGNGKGKTTAAIGQCIRAAGAKKKILIYQFLKNGSSNEYKILKNIPNINFAKNNINKINFVSNMSNKEKENLKEKYNEDLDKVFDYIKHNNVDVLFFDEILHAIYYGFIELNKVIWFLENRPKNLEIIMTGWKLFNDAYLYADYMTHFEKIKHPYDRGITARKGIEY